MLSEGGQADNNAFETTARMYRPELDEQNSLLNIEPSCVPRVRVGMRTAIGRVREHNEDNLSYTMPDNRRDWATRGALYMVCDGMGGHSAGQIASEKAIQLFTRSYYADQQQMAAEAMKCAVNAANVTVLNMARTVGGLSGMGTTLVAVALIEDAAWIVNVGDSRCYHVRGDVISQITKDHSLVGDQLRMGLLTREQADNATYRNVITRAIGVDGAEGEVFYVPLLPGDKLLLCSDGLTTHVGDESILTVLMEHWACQAAEKLVDMAIDDGGKDNCTVIVLDYLESVLLDQAVELGLCR